MKKALLTASLLFAQSAMAAQFSSRNSTGVLDLNFAAPVVSGDPLATNSRIGSLIYEAGSNTFRGLFADGTWRVISQGISAPNRIRFTSSGTYTPTAGAVYFVVEMAGAGGSGGGGGTGSGNGNAGSAATTFGSILTANVGGGGSSSAGTTGGTGGTASVSSPAILIHSQSGAEGASTGSGVIAFSTPGGNNPFSGAGVGRGPATLDGIDAVASTGGGGAGGASTSTNGGSAGGAGGYIKAQVDAVDFVSSYAVTIGAGGAGGAAGSSGGTGGDGAGGIVIVTEYFQ